MSATIDTVVWVRCTDGIRIEEAYRAAVGLGLRGARVALVGVMAAPEASPLMLRAERTLRELGHLVEVPCTVQRASALCRGAKSVEIWT